MNVKPMARKINIAIIGGGFAGTTTALHLEKLLRRRPHVQVTLIDAENFFTFTPLLPEVPSGSIQAKHIVFPLRALLKRTQVRQAHVHSIDLDNQIIVAAHCNKCGADRVPFDHLVLAPGAVSNYFNLPGVEEHSLTIKSLADATALHAHVIDKLEHADLQGNPAVRRELLTFVVAGGGFAGVETLAEMNDFVHGARRFYRNVQKEDIRMILVHSGKRILPEVNESLSKYAVEKLRRRGVHVLLETRVLGCENGRLKLSDGQEFPANTFVWAAGTAPSPILQRLDVPRSKTGRIDVDATMAVRGQPGVWAIGDSATIPDLITGGTCPPTAQFALRQGKRLAKNIVAALDGKPSTDFKFKSLGLLAGLGHRSAVAEIFGLRFSGFIAWWLWRTIYLMKLPGFERKLRVALDWTMDLFFPRDIVYLRPLHSAQGPGAVSIDAGIETDEAVCELPIHSVHSSRQLVKVES
ncbi:MAG: NAD(P)/FAD-dependent oxidoreductase [Pirellulaceae bacterium]